MPALYNEFEAYPAMWLRNLIAAGHIAPGAVDERSIVDLKPSDVEGYSQAHFFAGIAGWSRAFRLAGIPDEPDGLKIFSGSCPCQPFSNAGKRKGTDDERHLWPVWFELIKACRPDIVFGEQIAAPLGRKWLASVLSDLASVGYLADAVDLPACSVEAPHIRQRLWFVAVAKGVGQDRFRRAREWRSGSVDGRLLGNSGGGGGWRDGRSVLGEEARSSGERVESRDLSDVVESSSSTDGRDFVADSDDEGRAGISQSRLLRDVGNLRIDANRRGEHDEIGCVGDADVTRSQGRLLQHRERAGERALGPSGLTGGFWRDVRWIQCSDGKVRPVSVEPALLPLAPRLPGRVGQLSAAGNSINPVLAAVFIEEALAWAEDRLAEHT